MEMTTFDAAEQAAEQIAESPPETGPAIVHSASACRVIGDILSRVGDKWSMLVVMTLLEGDLHFNELKREINGISQQMLSRTLRALERDGLVVRTVHASVPVRVEYSLSDLGRSLSQPVQALGSWAFANRPAIEASRSVFDERSDA
ncbi:helix-turn-helix domain-containing protein [Novosphingobium sp. ST904]|uniref:winged helix-turn-helix transcriptional regulator n=1 Tax=Novosphingobium sp. ST904 TaxID=1684385 RepID=UPI0009E78C16|nr:helix-turn-helix domain-containing protein [Novosphingobium sp. ST904]TCM43266.1 HxlR family transcriptional regulator [Novosphingobium sp. ST904]